MLTTVSPDLSLIISSFLSPRDSLRLGMTCKTYYQAINQNERDYWLPLFKKSYPIAYKLLNESTPSVQWRAAYIQYYCSQSLFSLPPSQSTEQFAYEYVYLSNEKRPLLYKHQASIMPLIRSGRRYQFCDEMRSKSVIKTFNYLNPHSMLLALDNQPRRFLPHEITQLICEDKWTILGLTNGVISLYDQKGNFKNVWKEHQTTIKTLHYWKGKVFSSAQGESIHIRSLNQLDVKEALIHASPITCFEVSQQGWIISGTQAGSLFIWHKDPLDQYIPIVLQSHSKAIQCIKLFQNILASADSQGEICLQTFSKKNCLSKFTVDLKGQEIHDMAICQYAILILSSKDIQIWDYNKKICLNKFANSNHYTKIILTNFRLTLLSSSSIQVIHFEKTPNKPMEKIYHFFKSILNSILS